MLLAYTHLLLIALVRELHVDIIVFADLGDDGSFAAYYFWVEFGVY